MKKTVIIVVGLLLCVVGATVIGQKKNYCCPLKLFEPKN